MKSKIIIMVLVITSLVYGTSTHATIPNIDCTSDDWKTCSYANFNIEICDKDGWQKYRCKAGFYYKKDAAPLSCTASCHPCPDGGMSDPDNNETITSCYQKPGTHSDKTGTYKVSANCYYKE